LTSANIEEAFRSIEAILNDTYAEPSGAEVNYIFDEKSKTWLSEEEVKIEAGDWKKENLKVAGKDKWRYLYNDILIKKNPNNTWAIQPAVNKGESTNHLRLKGEGVMGFDTEITLPAEADVDKGLKKCLIVAKRVDTISTICGPLKT
jgi:hypothetical protein